MLVLNKPTKSDKKKNRFKLLCPKCAQYNDLKTRNCIGCGKKISSKHVIDGRK